MTLRGLPDIAYTGNTIFDGALNDLRKSLASRSSFLVDGFFANNLAAGAGATTMNRAGWVAEAVAWSTSKWHCPKAGYVKGLFVATSAVITAGDITVKLFKSGVDSGLFVKYPVTTPLHMSSYFTGEGARFVPGDYLELKYTTAGGLTPTTVDIMAGFDVVLI